MEQNQGKMPYKASIYLKPESKHYQTYKKMISDGVFKDKQVFGISESTNDFVTVDPIAVPGALYCGGMGSGKSSALRFSIITQLLSNSEDTIFFVIDPIQGATEFSILLKQDPRLSSNLIIVKDDSDKMVNTIEVLYQEFLRRKQEFSHHDSRNIDDHRKNTGTNLSKIVIAFENFHVIPNLNCVKYHMNVDNTDSTAYKLRTLMRTGRSYGISFMIATQRATSDDIPSSLKPGLNMHMCFYMRNPMDISALHLPNAQDITLSERGRCAYENGFMQFPYLDDSTILELTKEFFKPLKSSFLYFNTKDDPTAFASINNELNSYNSILKINPLKSQPTPKKVEEIIGKILKIPVTNDLKNKLYDFYNEISKKDLTPGQIISYFLRSSKFFFKTEPEIADLQVLVLKQNECEPTQEKMDQIISYISLLLNKKFSPSQIDLISLTILNQFRLGKYINWDKTIQEIEQQIKKQKPEDHVQNDSYINDFLLDLTLKINNAINSNAKSFCINEEIFNKVASLNGIEQLKTLINSLKDKNLKIEKNLNGEIIISDREYKISYNDFVDSIMK